MATTYIKSADHQREMSELEAKSAYKQAEIRLETIDSLLTLVKQEINLTPAIVGSLGLDKLRKLVTDGKRQVEDLHMNAQENS